MWKHAALGDPSLEGHFLRDHFLHVLMLYMLPGVGGKVAQWASIEVPRSRALASQRRVAYPRADDGAQRSLCVRASGPGRAPEGGGGELNWKGRHLFSRGVQHPQRSVTLTPFASSLHRFMFQSLTPCSGSRPKARTCKTDRL